jgi:hypothetical protein
MSKALKALTEAVVIAAFVVIVLIVVSEGCTL